VYGRRLDGRTNDDFPTARVPGDASTLEQRGEPVENTPFNRNRSDLDFRGSAMPPPEAVAAGKVQPITDEDRLTLVRWIDLGCPIDLDYDPSHPERRGYGWQCDDKRPTLSITYPKPGENKAFDRILISAFDYGTGLNESSLTVTADFAINGIPAGENLAGKFTGLPGNRWELNLNGSLGNDQDAILTVSIKDGQGNITRLQRTFSRFNGS
jgi:hypothetical protein